MTAAQRARRQAEALAAFGEVEDRAERVIRRSFRRVLRKLASRLGATVTAAAEAVSPDDLNLVFALWAEEVDGDLSAFFDRVFRAGADSLASQLPEALAQRLSQIGEPEMRRLLAERAVDYMSGARNRLSGFGDEIWSEARDALAEGIAEGEGVAELGSRLTDLLDVMEWRSRAIARTESLEAMNQGALAQAREMAEFGPTTKVWLATDDDRTDEECIDLDGEEVGIDEEFSSGDDAPPSHTNCRCTLIWGGTPTEEEADASDIDEALTDTPIEEPEENTLTAGGAAMPYEIVENADGCPTTQPWGVVKQGTAEVMGCHASKDDAQAQMDALYAQEGDAGVTAAYDLVNNAEGCDPATPWGVVDVGTGAVLSCHASEEEGQAEIDALIADEQQGNASLAADLAAAVVPQEGGFHAVLVVEGVESGDGRVFNEGALEWRDLPIPLRWIPADEGQHVGAVVAGRIDRIERQGAQIHGWGSFDLGGEYGAEAHRLVQDLFLRGVSVDLDDVKDSDVELVWPEDPAGDDGLEMLMMEPEKIIFHHGRICASTLVDIPAFQEAFIELDTAPAPLADEVAAEMAGALAGISAGITDTLSAAADDAPSGAMIALVPSQPDIDRLVLAGGEPPEDLHVTLQFLGDAAAVTPEARRAILEGAEKLASEQRAFSASAFAPALFNPTGDEPAWVLFIGDDGGTFLSDVHCGTSAVLADAEATGWQAAPNHAPWVPHLTLAYRPKGAPPSPDDLAEVVARCGIVSFDRLRVALGADVRDFGFGQLMIPTPADALVASAIPVSPPASWFADPEFSAPQRNLVVTPEGRVMGHLFQWRQCHVSSGPFGQVCQMPPENDDFSFFLTGDVETEEGDLVPTGRLVMGMKHAARHLRAAAATAYYDDTNFARADVTIGADRFGAWVSGALRPETTPEQIRGLRASSLSGDWRKIGGRLRLVGALVVNVPGFPVERAAAGIVAGEQVSLVAAGSVHELAADDALLSIADRIARSVGRDPTTKAAALAAQIGR